MTFRPHKVFKAILPLIFLAGLLIAGVYAWSMQGQLVNQVSFGTNLSHLTARDKAEIRDLLLNHEAIKHPNNRLVRFHIDMNRTTDSQNADSGTWYTGDIYPNTTHYYQGLVSVAQRDGQWQVTFMGLVPS